MGHSLPRLFWKKGGLRGPKDLRADDLLVVGDLAAADGRGIIPRQLVVVIFGLFDRRLRRGAGGLDERGVGGARRGH